MKSNQEFLDELKACFQGRFILDPEEMAGFLLDWRKRYKGKALAVVQPHSTQDVAAIVKCCMKHQVAIVPQGGSTGLSGGSVPNPEGQSIVLSLLKLNQIRHIDIHNNTITVEAGCVLQTIQQQALAHKRLFPLSLASQGSCTIGGNLSSNAGGVQVLRYGNARALCLGLEVVTANGEIWNGLRGLRKDNTGYDLRDLYIGAEGTLGIITAAVLQLYPQPQTQLVSWLAVDNIQHAVQLLALAQSYLGAGLTAFELISKACLNLVLHHFKSSKPPLENSSEWNILLEFSSSSPTESAHNQLALFLESALAQGLIQDATISQSEQQFKQLWSLRENISEAQALEGKNIKHDVALPISKIAEFVESTEQLLNQAFPSIQLICFGHLGDGNLHFNVSLKNGLKDPLAQEQLLANQEAINLITHNQVAHFNGSISAEHGLGVLRRDEAARYKSEVELLLMAQIKKALDPFNLMNPGKVLPPKLLA
jgi:FAD/FMN-containing dehydrogenase